MPKAALCTVLFIYFLFCLILYALKNVAVVNSIALLILID